MMNKKIILLMSAFVFIIVISTFPVPVHAGIPKSWHNLGMTGGTPLFGTYNAGTMVATEQYLQPPVGQGVYVFAIGWDTVNPVPTGSDIFDVRVKFYFKAYYYWPLPPLYYSEGMDLLISRWDGTKHWGTYTYYPANYLNGATIYVYLGADAKGHKLSVDFYDHNDVTDLSPDAWYLGAPVVQIYTYDY